MLKRLFGVRVKNIVEGEIKENQLAFWKVRATDDGLFVIKTNFEKRRYFRNDRAFGFVDL